MTPALRTLAFGELEPAGAWGAAWVANADGEPLAAVGAGSGWTSLLDLHLSGDEASEEWRLDGGAAQLTVVPVGEAVGVQPPDDGIEGWAQLCRVGGRFQRDGAELAVDCLGLRTWWSGAIDLERFESIRSVAAWFEPGEALALTAFRPRKAKAHDRDLIAAAVIAPDGSAPVEDPRLSTTYAGDGWPARAGLELWLAGEEQEREYPHRASGEATGARAQARDGALQLRAEPFRWHRRGREGAGMYLLARPA
ncbi:MAG: hypothetical protein JO304_16950 [Solirubrobacterales bacterium]|nr:hypothetical protein [Solirubrobacterales bacterium]